MAILSAIFRGVDEMSNTLDSMASSGEAAVKQWESAGDTAKAAFSQASSGAAEAAQAANAAASSTDYWTDAVGSYDKSAMEAVYTTEELVEMGFKTEEALEAAATAAEENSDAIEKGTRVMEEFRATISEQETELERLQEAYMGISLTMGENSDEATAMKSQIDELSGTLKDNRKELEDLEEQSGKTGDAGNEMVDKIEDALTAAALAATIKEVAEAVIEMGNAFSEAESIVVKATGATGEALESLDASMMKVYSSVDDGDLNNTAATIGELNTRLHLQGEELEHVGNLFMTYADNTNSDAVTAVQNVTKVMKNWNVEVSETESLLDKLTYAGQASGASVDTLSNLVVTNKASLQELGYSLDESIALLSMFEYQGLNSTSIMMGFRSAIAKFSDDGKDASTAMQDVIDQISSMSDTSAATALAVDTFGTRAGPELAYAIRSGKFEIEEWTAAIEKSNGTLARTDEAADTVADKWTQATNSMNTAFSNVLSPTVNGLSVSIAGLVSGVGEFLTAHPAVTAALTAVGVGLAALAGYIIVAKVAALLSIPSFTAMGAAIWAATGPIGLIVAGVAALVAGVALLVSWIGEQNKEFNELTATSKQQYEQIEDLNDEYDRAVELYGKNSEEAKRLSEEIAGLEAQFEASKMTLEEFVAQNDALIESHDKLIESYNSSMDGLDKEEQTTTALIGRLETLASKTNRTAGEQQQMEAIIDKLNEQVPELALNYDDFSGSVDRSVASVKALAEAEAKKKRQEAQYDSYVKLLSDQADLQEQLAKATEQTAAAQERYDSSSGWDRLWNVGKVKSDLEDFTAEQERLQAALDETNDLISEQEEAFEEAAAAVENSAGVTVDYETAVNQAIQSVSDEISELVEKYDEAYAAARDSIDGQIGLFDTMKTETELSISDMQTAMQSQIDYLATYTENLQKAAQYGLDEGLIASLSDGSAESAGYINAIIESIEKLGGTTEGLSDDAAAFVEKFNGQFQEVETAKNNFAGTVAEMETDFNAKMGEIENRMNTAIDNMNMSDDAALAAKDTISAYVESIRSMTGEAHNAAAAVAAAAQSGLKSKGISTVGIPGYATGTTDAPDMFIAGEEGPELIVGAGGSTVFPADETSQILSAAGRTPLNTAAPDSMELDDGGDAKTTIEKKITLEIAGSGAIDVSGPYDEERMTSLLFANLKPALMGLLKQEIYEEGDLAYEF